MTCNHFVLRRSLLIVSLIFAALSAFANPIKVPGDHAHRDGNSERRQPAFEAQPDRELTLLTCPATRRNCESFWGMQKTMPSGCGCSVIKP